MATENQNDNVQTQERQLEGNTFTQADLDRIINKRFAKYADYDDLKAKADKLDEIEQANKSELQKVTERAEKLQAELDGIRAENAIRDIRSKIADETGVPASLLTATDEDECREQAKAILDYATPKSYPNVRDGGEVTHTGKPSTRQQFAEWANKAFG